MIAAATSRRREIYLTVKTIEIIQRCDADFKKRLYTIAESIYNDGVRLVSLSGPTCSGKTTAAHMLSKRLGELGKNAHIVSIDDFYYDREYLDELSRKKGLDTIDYDSVDTIDIGALKAFVEEMYTADTVHCPVFDFKLGKSVRYRSISAGENDLFIFEGIQAIYPEVSAVFKQYPSISVYICAASAVDLEGTIFEPNEVRFLRRIVRDYNFRGASPEFSMFLWESVRHNEDLSIFPYVNNCDMHIDSTLPFEINVLKPYLDDILSKVSPNSEFIEETRRIIEKIKDIKPIPREYLSKNSLYNEFI